MHAFLGSTLAFCFYTTFISECFSAKKNGISLLTGKITFGKSQKRITAMLKTSNQLILKGRCLKQRAQKFRIVKHVAGGFLNQVASTLHVLNRVHNAKGFTEFYKWLTSAILKNRTNNFVYYFFCWQIKGFRVISLLLYSSLLLFFFTQI